MVKVAKRFKTYVSLGTWALPWGKFIAYREGALLPRELGPFLEENSLLLGEVVFFPSELFLLFVKVVFLGYFICFLGNFFAPCRTYIVP